MKIYVKLRIDYCILREDYPQIWEAFLPAIMAKVQY